MTEPANPEQAGAPQRPLGPHPGSEPRANPSARWMTIVIGALLLALAAVIAREIWYRHQDGTFDSWVDPVFMFFGTADVDVAGVIVGILVSLVGLWLLISAFLPRPRTHVQVNSPASIWVRPVDIARKATATARAETGGTNVRSKADRKSVTVHVDDDGTGMAQEQVAAALNDQFRRLAAPPSVSVKLNPPAQQATREAAPAPAPVPAQTQTVTVTETKEVQR